MNHPGGFGTVRDWALSTANASGWSPTGDALGEIQLNPVNMSVAWDSATSTWRYDLQASDVSVRNNAGGTVTPNTVTGTAVMEWTGLANLFTVTITFDATI